MGKKSKKKKHAASATASPDDETHDSKVADALLEAWKARYPSSDEDVAEQEVDLMRKRGHCCYAVLQEGVQKQHFDGVTNFLVMPEYVDVAAEAVQRLTTDAAFMSMQTSQKHCPVALTQPETICKTPGEKLHATAKSGTHDKPQTMAECNKPKAESRKPVLSRGHVEIEKIGMAGGTLLQQAEDKARTEMQQTFKYELLCEQGKQLYNLVLQDKTKRFHSKLKHRNKWKQKTRASQP